MTVCFLLDNNYLMATIKLNQVAKYLEVSAPFLCGVRKGNKAFSKQKARSISEKTGIPIEKMLFANGDDLYRALVLAYTLNAETNQ